MSFRAIPQPFPQLRWSLSSLRGYANPVVSRSIREVVKHDPRHSVALHIVAGGAALASAGLAIVSAKGGRTHRLAGRVYTVVHDIRWAQCPCHGNGESERIPFRDWVSSASTSSLPAGARQRWRDGRPRLVDHGGGAMMTLAGLAMFGWGRARRARGSWRRAGFNPSGFPVLSGLCMALMDLARLGAGARIIGKSRDCASSRPDARSVHCHDHPRWAWSTSTICQNSSSGSGPTAILTPVIFWWTARVMNGATRP